MASHFEDSTILKKKAKQNIRSMIDDLKECRLLVRGSESDGFNPEVYAPKLYKKAPLLFIFKPYRTTNIFGAYTDIAWTNGDRSETSGSSRAGNSFIFKVLRDGKIERFMH